MNGRGPRDGTAGRRSGASARDKARGNAARFLGANLLPWIPFLLAVLVYAPTLKHSFVWDDVTFIVENPAAHRLGGLSAALSHGYGWVPGGSPAPDASLYFRPLVTLVNTLNWVSSGGRPWAFHLRNLLAHAGAAAMLSLLALWLGLSGVTACLLGAVFAFHPAISEAVAWISGRTDVFAGFFSLACLVLLLGWRQGRCSRWIAPRLPWSAALALFLALSSKESAAALFVLAPLLLLLPRAQEMVQSPRPAGPRPAGPRPLGGAPPAARAAWITLLLAILLYLILRVAALKGGAFGGGALLTDRGSLPGRALLGGNLLLLYLLRVLVPWPLATDGPAYLTGEHAPALGGVAGLLLLIALLILWTRMVRGLLRGGRGTAGPAAVVGLGLFLLSLLPVLQFISTGEIYGERFLYLPLAGLLLCLGALADGPLRARPRAAWLVLLLLGLPYVCLLEARLPDWKDEITLFTSSAKVHPRCARALANLGSAQMKLGREREAEGNLAQAVLLDPKDPWKRAQYGSLLVNLGRVEDGARELQAAWDAGSRSRTLYKNLGVARTRQGRYEDAAALLSQAEAMDPLDPGTQEALGMAERKGGHLGEAALHYRRAIELDPARRSAWLNLLSMLANESRAPAEARALAERFLRQFPGAPEAAQVRKLLPP